MQDKNVSQVQQGFGLRRWGLIFPTALIFLLVACSQRGRAQITVSVSPASASVATMAIQQYTATVIGTTNTAVTWEVNNIPGGNSSIGTISTAGLYVAPAAEPGSGTVTITALSEQDYATTGSTSLTITPPPSSGVTYYVSTTGNDSNPGTASQPWRTIQHAANTVQAGDTVDVEGGTYNEQVSFPSSGNATDGYITFQNYPGETPIVDGTGLKLTSGEQLGLFDLESDNSYVIIQGFTIQNYKSSVSNAVPIGINIEGSGTNIEILSNHIQYISTTAGSNCNLTNALGMAIYGTEAPASIQNITIAGNQLNNLTLGCSESLSVNGNVQYFAVMNNLIHDNNNIGIDAIGFEQTAPQVAYDQARDGEITQNTVYNITGLHNPVYKSLGADGIYSDGGTRIVIDRNDVHNTDLGIELASENAGRTTSYVIARNNLVYKSQMVGISIGGYSGSVGGTDHCMILNNTLWDNDTANTGSGEFQVQFHATNNVFENNILYASSHGLFINDFTASEPNPVQVDYNLYFSSVGQANGRWIWQKKTYTGYAAWLSGSKQDADSPSFSDPLFVNTSSTPPNLDIQSGSPAVANGNFGSGGSYLIESQVGPVDYAGNPRFDANWNIDIGAYQP